MCTGYSFDDLVLSYNGAFDQTFKMAKHGPEHIIRPAPGQIKYLAEENTLSLNFNTSLSYIITFVDPKYQLLSVHPTAIPKTIVKIGEESGVTLVYLKVKRSRSLQHSLVHSLYQFVFVSVDLCIINHSAD